MKLKEDINFSLWCDFIERNFLENKFQDFLNEGIVHGATSNPAIFEQSISTSDAYKQQISMLQANEAKKIYEEVALTDIKRAADIMKPLHEDNEDDGFISIEVDPLLCDDMMGTIEEGTRLATTINKENVMIKIPATEAGYGAMKELTAMGISVNATLIFSPAQAIKCAKALDEGIKKSNKSTKGVISVFVSRFDRMCDNEMLIKELPTGKFGIINATKCYHEVEKFGNENIRTLFASTGVKGDDLPASYYIDNLLYPNSINTAPIGAINAWIEQNGQKVIPSVPAESECDTYLNMLEKSGISVTKVYNKLLSDGLSAFKDSFKDLLHRIKD